MIRETPALGQETSARPDRRALVEELGTDALRPISRAEFDRMVAAGVFAPDDARFELLRGVLVGMTPVGPDHQESVDLLNAALTPALLGKARVRIQGPFAASDDSEPEPDVGVYPPGRYGEAHPTRALLLIEVAQSSLARDRGIKRTLYAEARVAEYWILNLLERRLEVHRAPRDGDYARVLSLGPDDEVSPEAFPEVRLRVGDLLP